MNAHIYTALMFRLAPDKRYDVDMAFISAHFSGEAEEILREVLKTELLTGKTASHAYVQTDGSIADMIDHNCLTAAKFISANMREDRPDTEEYERWIRIMTSPTAEWAATYRKVAP